MPPTTTATSSRPLPSLLILPPAPHPATHASLKAAYAPPLTAALTTISASRLSLPTILEILLPVPIASASPSFQSLQHLLARTYSLLTLLSAKHSIPTHGGPGAIDCRVILLDTTLPTSTSSSSSSQISSSGFGPIISLSAFAAARKAWRTIFLPDGESSLAIYDEYVSCANAHLPILRGEVRHVRGGISFTSTSTATRTSQTQSSNGSNGIQSSPAPTLAPQPQSQSQSQSESQPKTHNAVAVGGTFDHLHAGHKLLLTATALVLQLSLPPTCIAPSQAAAKRLIVGITGDALLVNKKYAQYLESWSQRQESVTDFLTSILYFPDAAAASSSSSSSSALTSSASASLSTSPAPTPNPSTQTTTTSTTTTPDAPAAAGQQSTRIVHTTFTAGPSSNSSANSRSSSSSSTLTIETVEIHDPFGPTITDEAISALVVSGETRGGGEAVNAKRVERGWEGLEVWEVEVLDGGESSESESEGGEGEQEGEQVKEKEVEKEKEGWVDKISSTAIRKGLAKGGSNSGGGKKL